MVQSIIFTDGLWVSWEWQGANRTMYWNVGAWHIIRGNCSTFVLYVFMVIRAIWCDGEFLKGISTGFCTGGLGGVVGHSKLLSACTATFSWGTGMVDLTSAQCLPLDHSCIILNHELKSRFLVHKADLQIEGHCFAWQKWVLFLWELTC